MGTVLVQRAEELVGNWWNALNGAEKENWRFLFAFWWYSKGTFEVHKCIIDKKKHFPFTQCLACSLEFQRLVLLESKSSLGVKGYEPYTCLRISRYNRQDSKWGRFSLSVFFSPLQILCASSEAYGKSPPAAGDYTVSVGGVCQPDTWKAGL